MTKQRVSQERFFQELNAAYAAELGFATPDRSTEARAASDLGCQPPTIWTTAHLRALEKVSGRFEVDPGHPALGR